MSTITHRSVASTVGVGAILLGAGCGSSTDSVATYSADSLLAGVELDLDDPGGIAESGVVFLPDDLPTYQSLTPQLEGDGVTILDPGEADYDVTVVYRTGPYCGLLPIVALRTEGARIEIEVTSHLADDLNCESTEYDEAVGLNLAPGFEALPVVATSQRCLVQHPDVCTPTGASSQGSR